MKISLVTQFVVGNSYRFRFLQKQEDKVLLFSKSLYEESKPIIETKFSQTSASTSSLEFIKIEDLKGLEKKFMSVTLKAKILKIEIKSSKNGNQFHEVFLADQTGSTYLTIWKNQEKALRNLKVGAIVQLSNFVVSNWPKNNKEPKHLSWDLYKVKVCFEKL